MQRIRWWLWSIPAFLGVGLVAVLLLRPQERDGLEELRWRLRSFDSVSVELVLGGYGLGVEPTHRLVARRDRKLGVEVLGVDPEERYVLDRDRAWTVRQGTPIPVPGWGARGEEVWNEARSGLAHMRFTPQEPQDLGLPEVPGRLEWLGAELPFEWSQGWRLLLAFSSRGQLRYVLVVEPGAAESHLATITSLRWDGPVPPRLLGPQGE